MEPMTGPPRRLLPVIAFQLIVLAACGASNPTPSADLEGPRVTILSPDDGATLGGNVVVLEVQAEGVEIVPADGDASSEKGHYHVFIDRDPVAPGDVIPEGVGIVHSTEGSILIPGLPTGDHMLRVVLGDGRHARIGSQVAPLSVTLQGPSIQATAPPRVRAGESFEIEITADGVKIGPDENVAGMTGLLYLFIDPPRPPQTSDTPIPDEDGIIRSGQTTIGIEGLSAGERTIWVVLAHHSGIPFDPPVMAKVEVLAR